MAEHRLDPLLQPASIALLGASERAGSPGRILAEMVIESDYQGEIFPVNSSSRLVTATSRQRSARRSSMVRKRRQFIPAACSTPTAIRR
jgi:hypothetical protein